MKPKRTLNRRSFLRRVGGAAVGGGALLAVLGGAGAAQSAPRRTGITDRDGGRNADEIGYGRGGRQTAFSDGDHENPQPIGDTFQSDPPPGKRTGITDRDGGPAADPVGYGSQPRPTPPRPRRP